MNKKDKQFLLEWVLLNELIGNVLRSVEKTESKEVHTLFVDAFSLQMTRIIAMVIPDLEQDDMVAATIANTLEGNRSEAN